MKADNPSSDLPIIIIGAGLCGLYLSFLLEQQGEKVILLEANNTTGGRIQTTKTSPTIEMGATWFNNHHRKLIELLKEFNLQYTEQFVDKKAFYEP